MEKNDKEFIEIKKSKPLPKPHVDKNTLGNYWDEELLRCLCNTQLLIPITAQKPTIKERISTWFLDKFADLYEKVRGDIDE